MNALAPDPQAEASVDAQQARQRFFELVDEVCEELGYPPRSNRPEKDEVVAMEMDLDGYPFAVVHSLAVKPERLLIECRFGAAPSENRSAVLDRLLQLNYALADVGEAIFALDVNGDVLYTRSILLSEQSSSSLLAGMTQMSWQSRQWNEHRFLEVKEPASSLPPPDFNFLA